ncbi:MAG: PAS domain S-box protein [Bacteroidetes bacterium]|nr:PAS domain S-box protein [Bacteroidota bacterium]
MNVLLLGTAKNETIRITEIVREAGIEHLSYCSNFHEFQQIISGQKADLILSAMQFGDYSAYDVQTHAAVKSKIPVVVVAEKFSDADIRHLFEHDIRDFLPYGELLRLPFMLKHMASCLKTRKNLDETIENLNRAVHSKTALVGRLPGLVYRCSPDKKRIPVFLSEQCDRVTGHAATHLYAHGLEPLIHPDDQDNTARAIENAIATKSFFEIRYRVLSATGETRHIWEKGNAVYDALGHAEALEGVIFDVTHNRKNDELIQKINCTVNIEAGEEYFSKLTRFLFENTQSKAIMVGRYLKEKNAVQTISYRVSGVEQDNITYNLANTPCDRVMKAEVCIYSSGIQEKFPEDIDLVHLNAVSYAGVPVLNGENKAIGLIVLIHDKPLDNLDEQVLMLQWVSSRTSTELERMATAELLVHNEKKYRDVVENQSEMIVRWNGQGKILFSNRSYQRYHRLSEAELLNKSVYQLVKDHSRFETKIRQLSVEQNTLSDIHESVDHTGKKVWHEWTDRAFFDSTGRLLEIQSIGRDITIQVQAEMEIVAREKFSQSVFSAIRDHIVVITREGIIVSTNKGWHKYSQENKLPLKDSGIGSNYLEAYCTAAQEGDESAKRALEGIESVIYRKSRSFEMEYPCHSAGSRSWFIMRVSPLDIEKGGAVITHTDITDKKNKELELSQSYDEILHTQQISQALINGSSTHDLADLILAGIHQMVSIERGRIYLYDKNTHSLHLYSRHLSSDFATAAETKDNFLEVEPVPELIPGGLFNEAITGQKIILTHDNEEIKTLLLECAYAEPLHKHGIRTFGLYPLMRGTEVIGLLSAGTPFILNEREKNTLFRFAQRASLVFSRKQDRDELIRSEEKFKAISNCTANWENWLDTNGKPIWINPAVVSHFGYTAEELLEMPDFFKTIIYSEDYDRVMKILGEALLNATEGEKIEIRCSHKNGSVRWFSISWKQVYSSNGKWIGIRTSGSDITKLKLQEAELIQRTNDLKEAQSIAGLGAWSWEPCTCMFRLCERMCAIIGIDCPNGFLDSSVFFEMVHPESRKKLSELLRQVTEESFSRDVEIQLCGADGKEKYMLFRAKVVPNPLTRGFNIQGTALDITELKTSFLRSRESQEKFQKIFESIQDVYYQVNAEGLITLLSPSIKTLTGYEPDELIGKPIAHLFPDAGAAYMRKKINQKFPFKKGGNFEAKVISRKGEDVIASVIMSPFSTGNGSAKIIQGVMRDITDKKRQEERLENQRRRLLEIVKLNTQIIETSDHFYYVLQISEDQQQANQLKYVSLQVSEILGVDELDLLNLGNRWNDLIHPDDIPEVEKTIALIISQKIPQCVSYRIRHRVSGELRWVDDYACPLLNTNNEVVEIFGSVKDVSDRVNSIIRITEEKKQSMAYQYRLLSSQLNPHFIYNTLNSFQYYILEGNVEASLNHISDFSVLMRQVLENSMNRYITIDEELVFLEQFIKISKQRMSGELTFKVIVDPELETGELFIPPMLLQPYLENAMIHGFIKCPRDPEIKVTIRKTGNRLECMVTDNGIGREQSQKLIKTAGKSKRKSHGIGIIKERIDLLNQLTNEDFRFYIEDLHDAQGEPVGTNVIVSFNCIYN